MKPILLVGSLIVTLALISYSIGIFREQQKRIITKPIQFFLGLGLLLDISGTACMLIGSTNSPFTYHGFMGYSALLAMLMDNLLLWKLRKTTGLNAPVPATIHKYSLIAYSWWVFVYVSGFLMAMNK